MKTILATTYAVNPLKGSEDGMGWNFVLQIARFNKVIAITRENNREHIEKYMDEHPDQMYANIRFLYFDLPYWMRFWKRKGRGAMLYYLMWQRAIVSFVKKQQIDFDIAHNLNFHNDWTPSWLWKMNKPFVWGPVGHHPLIPAQYLKPYKMAYLMKDRLTWMMKKFFWKSVPALKRTVRKADHIWAMNSSVRQVLNLHPDKFSLVPSVATTDFGYEPVRNREKFTLISAGRLVPLKGYDLTIRAFARFLSGLQNGEKNKCELIIVGKGPEKGFYGKMTEDLGIAPFVKIIHWMDRTDLMELFRNSTAFIFPSHEGAGMVVPEALSFGLPVICLANCGPGEFVDHTCGFTVPQGEYDATVHHLSNGISMLYQDPALLEEMSAGARRRFENLFSWEKRGEQLKTIYEKL